MIPEEVWYLFVFPWMLFIATIPGAVITFMLLGAVATLSNYLPESSATNDP